MSAYVSARVICVQLLFSSSVFLFVYRTNINNVPFLSDIVLYSSPTHLITIKQAAKLNCNPRQKDLLSTINS